MFSGQGPSNPYRCTSCNFITANYGQWELHLTSWLHQKALYETPGHGEVELDLPHVRGHVIIVSRVPEAIPLIELAKHFSNSGPIANLIFGGKELNLDDVYGELGPTKQIMVVFTETDAVWRAIQEENTWLCGAQIGIRPKVTKQQGQSSYQDWIERQGGQGPFGIEGQDQYQSWTDERQGQFGFEGHGHGQGQDWVDGEHQPQFGIAAPATRMMASVLQEQIAQIEYGNGSMPYFDHEEEDRMMDFASDEYEPSISRSRISFPSSSRSRHSYSSPSPSVSTPRPSFPSPSKNDDSSAEEENETASTNVKIPDKKPAAEDSSWEMDTDDEENPVDSFEQVRRGKITVNQSLRHFFEKGIAEIEGAEEIDFMDVRQKFQSLWLQYILEFNSKFWTTCFGFEIDSLYSEPDFSKTDLDTAGTLTLRQRFDSIPALNPTSNLEYHVSTTNNEISDLLYKKKVWKKAFLFAHLRALWAVVTNNVTIKADEGVDTSPIEKRVTLAPSKKMEFNVRLDTIFDLRELKDVPKNENISAFVHVSLRDVSYSESGAGLRNKKLRFLVSVYEKLALRYCNLRIKQWIGSCQGVDYKAFDDSYKVEKKRRKRKIEGHPKWRKFKRIWSLKVKEREEMEERDEKEAKLKQEMEKAWRLKQAKKTPEELEKEAELEGNYGWPRSNGHVKFVRKKKKKKVSKDNEPELMMEIEAVVEELVVETVKKVEQGILDGNQPGKEVEITEVGTEGSVEKGQVTEETDGQKGLMEIEENAQEEVVVNDLESIIIGQSVNCNATLNLSDSGAIIIPFGESGEIKKVGDEAEAQGIGNDEIIGEISEDRADIG